jgi:ABC-2 type transport system permease protein
MPGRIALGAAAWWEPVLAVTLTLAAIAGLVVFAGRVYTSAILHTGPTLKLRDVWRRTLAPGSPAAGTTGARHRGLARAIAIRRHRTSGR